MAELPEEKVDVGLPIDKPDDYQELPLVDAHKNYSTYRHACHVFLYALDPGRLIFNRPELRVTARIMMQFRFDGSLGFPGGLVDDGEPEIHTALNRELVEEIGLDPALWCTLEDHLISHVNHKKQFVAHFFQKKLSLSEYDELERGTGDAVEWGVETAGILRVPLYTMEDGYRGLPLFLCNRFAGNARCQLLLCLRRLGILSDEEIDKADQASQELLAAR